MTAPWIQDRSLRLVSMCLFHAPLSGCARVRVRVSISCCVVLTDEEMSGCKGMQKFVQHPRLAELNVGLALDEGLANPENKYTVRCASPILAASPISPGLGAHSPLVVVYVCACMCVCARVCVYATPLCAQVFYGERKIWWIHVFATGNVGHGSRFIQSTATEKLVRPPCRRGWLWCVDTFPRRPVSLLCHQMKVANHVLEYRRQQQEKLAHGKHKCGEPLMLGDVCTMNLTMLKAGSPLGGFNVIPGEAEAGTTDQATPCTVLCSLSSHFFFGCYRGWCGLVCLFFVFLRVVLFGWRTAATVDWNRL